MSELILLSVITVPLWAKALAALLFLALLVLFIGGLCKCADDMEWHKCAAHNCPNYFNEDGQCRTDKPPIVSQITDICPQCARGHKAIVTQLLTDKQTN